MTTKRKSPLRWRKEKRERWGSGPLGMEYCRGGEVFGRVSYDRLGAAWYFYRDGHNSLWEGKQWRTLEEAKDACQKHVKQWLAEKGE